MIRIRSTSRTRARSLLRVGISLSLLLCQLQAGEPEAIRLRVHCRNASVVKSAERFLATTYRTHITEVKRRFGIPPRLDRRFVFYLHDDPAAFARFGIEEALPARGFVDPTTTFAHMLLPRWRGVAPPASDMWQRASL